MKRALLIAGGTVGGLGAVLAITPPQFGATNALNISSGAIGATSGEFAPASSPTPANAGVAETTANSTKPSAAATKKPSSQSSQGAATNEVATPTSNSSQSSAPVQTQTETPAPTKSATATPTPTPAKTSAAPVSKGGTFTGPAVFVNYGTVQVKITVVNGRITDAVAVQAPTGRNDRWTNMAIPILKKQTLAAQSANIQGASGASYTSYGWSTSLQGALAQAGL